MPTGMGRRSCTDVQCAKARHAVGMANSLVDEVMLGAGISGLYATRRLRNLHGLSGRAFQAGRGPGGSCHWDQDPWARWDCRAPFIGTPSSQTGSESGASSLSATIPRADAIQNVINKRRPLGPNHCANGIWAEQNEPTHYRLNRWWRGEAIMP